MNTNLPNKQLNQSTGTIHDIKDLRNIDSISRTENARSSLSFKSGNFANYLSNKKEEDYRILLNQSPDKIRYNCKDK